MIADQIMDLAMLAADPDRVADVPACDVPRMIGEAEALKAKLWARLQEPLPALTATKNGNTDDRLLTSGGGHRDPGSGQALALPTLRFPPLHQEARPSRPSVLRAWAQAVDGDSKVNLATH